MKIFSASFITKGYNHIFNKGSKGVVMKQIVKFIDKNIDGCGTDIEVYVQTEGKTELTDAIITETNNKIEKYREENSGAWDTDSVIMLACDYLESKGYMCHAIVPNYVIEF